MPMYLVHGFRWPRRAIRIHIILENLDDCAAEYLSAPRTQATMLANLRSKYPQETALLPKLRLIEQYDPSDTSGKAISQPHAFVVDRVKVFDKGDLSFDVLEALRGMDPAPREQVEAMGRIKEGLAAEERTGVGWWVVYNGDEGRMDGVEAEGGREGKKEADNDWLEKESLKEVQKQRSRERSLRTKKSFKKLLRIPT